MTFTQKILYALIRGLLTCIALLPLRVLYLFADGLYFLIYYVARYRKHLVHNNLTQCFPEKSVAEIKCIERQFYHNFADYIVETIKLLHISDAEIKRRMQFENLEVIKELMDEGRTIVAYFAHVGNWEWAPSITLHLTEQASRGDVFCQIYRPLRNTVFNALMLHVRSRFGSVSIPKSLTLRSLLTMRRDGVTSITGFMSDQKPSHGDPIHTLCFLNRPTNVITGTETLSRRLNTAVVYWDMLKPSRGHYVIRVRLMSQAANNTPEFALTDSYFSMLQETINRNPAIWLWSHNRWKNIK